METPDQERPAGERPGARVVLRPIATPLPLGFLALFVATVTLSAVQLDWVGPAEGRVAAVAVLLLTSPLQGLAAVFGFLGRDPVAGTGMAIQAGAWAVVGVVTLAGAPGASSPALGVVLIAAAMALLVPAAAGVSKPLAAAVLGVAAARFAVTGVAELVGTPGWRTAAGVVGLVLALLAFYAALAFEVEGVRGRALLPLGRVGAAREAMSGDPAAQVSAVEHEAGVRRRL